MRDASRISVGESQTRKRLRVGHSSERGAVNAVRSLLEANGLVVSEVDGRSDYGRDLNVDVTEDAEITGLILGVQVKGDRRFIHDGNWRLPASPKDRTYWADSGIPIVGVLWDPDTAELRWANLTEFARSSRTLANSPYSAGEEVLFPPEARLEAETLADMLASVAAHVSRWGGSALLGLFDSDEESRVRAVQDCWALGRGDARALLLLRHVLPALRGDSQVAAIHLLALVGANPDIFYSERNWIHDHIKQDVRRSFRWSPREVVDLTQAVEEADEDSAWQRGGLGSNLYTLLAEDPDLEAKCKQAIAMAVDENQLNAAFRLVLIGQYVGASPYRFVERVLAERPPLRAHPLVPELLRLLDEYGFVDLF